MVTRVLSTTAAAALQVEIAMVEVYMDEVYDLLEPRKKDRQKLNVFNNKGEARAASPGHPPGEAVGAGSMVWASPCVHHSGCLRGMMPMMDTRDI